MNIFKRKRPQPGPNGEALYYANWHGRITAEAFPGSEEWARITD